jgi:hypothetical protein
VKQIQNYSEFMMIAKTIGKNIASTYAKLEKLTLREYFSTTSSVSGPKLLFSPPPRQLRNENRCLTIDQRRFKSSPTSSKAT